MGRTLAYAYGVVTLPKTIEYDTTELAGTLCRFLAIWQRESDRVLSGPSLHWWKT
jgi:hypothetical protein